MRREKASRNHTVFFFAQEREKGLLTRGEGLEWVFGRGKIMYLTTKKGEEKQRVFAPFFVCPKKAKSIRGTGLASLQALCLVITLALEVFSFSCDQLE